MKIDLLLFFQVFQCEESFTHACIESNGLGLGSIHLSVTLSFGSPMTHLSCSREPSMNSRHTVVNQLRSQSVITSILTTRNHCTNLAQITFSKSRLLYIITNETPLHSSLTAVIVVLMLNDCGVSLRVVISLITIPSSVHCVLYNILPNL